MLTQSATPSLKLPSGWTATPLRSLGGYKVFTPRGTFAGYLHSAPDGGWRWQATGSVDVCRALVWDPAQALVAFSQSYKGAL
jgi:hypothetical protein